MGCAWYITDTLRSSFVLSSYFRKNYIAVSCNSRHTQRKGNQTRIGFSLTSQYLTHAIGTNDMIQNGHYRVLGTHHWRSKYKNK